MAGLLLVLLLAGCANKDDIPSGVIPKPEMEKILFDLAQADQYASLFVTIDSARVNRKLESLKVYQEVFRLHQVSREDFRKSLQFYLDHPDIMRILLDSVLAEGNRLRNESYRIPHPGPTLPLPVIPVAKPGISPAIGSRPQIGPRSKADSARLKGPVKGVQPAKRK
jgi:hypothetical protein